MCVLYSFGSKICLYSGAIEYSVLCSDIIFYVH